MFRPGPEWIVVVLLILLLIFGAKRFPEIGSSLGRGLRSFKRSVTGEDDKKEGQDQGVSTAVDDDRT